MKNRKNIFVLLILLFFPSEYLFSDNIKVLFILPQKYGLNGHLSREMFDSFGWDVTIAGVDSIILPCDYSLSQGSKPFNVDITIAEINNVNQYDCIVISSMSWAENYITAYNDLMNCAELITLLNTANNEGIVIAATCAGVRVLATADIINGRNVTGKAGPNNYYANEYVTAGATFLGENILPVIDGNIVTTTRGQYYMKQNCEALMIAIQNSKNLRKNKEVK